MCRQLVLSLLFLFSPQPLLRKWLFHLVLLVILTWSIKGSLPGAYLVLEYHLSTLINVHFSSLVHWHFFFLFQGLGLKTNVPSYMLCVILCYLMISNFFNMLYPTQRTNAQKCRGEEQERKILTVRQETDNTSKSVDLVLVVQKSMSACVWKKHRVGFLGVLHSAAFYFLHLTLGFISRRTQFQKSLVQQQEEVTFSPVVSCVYLNKPMQVLLLTVTGLNSAGLAGFMLATVRRCYQQFTVYCLRNGIRQPAPGS